MGTLATLLFIVVVVFLVLGVRLVHQQTVLVVERLGVFSRTIGAGLHIIIPLIETVRAKVSLKQQILEIPKQEVITKDNTIIQVDSVVYYTVLEPEKAVYGVENYQLGVRLSAQTNLRNIIGDLNLDETLTSRDKINVSLRDVLDNETKHWGIRIDRVNLADVSPPPDIQRQMERQMAAERERREKVLQAQGDREAVETRAAGEKEAAIRKAEGEAQAIQKVAEAEAFKIRAVAAAQAEAVTKVLGAMKEAGIDDKVLALKSFEALEKIAEGKASKVFVPYEATTALASLGALSEMFKDVKVKGQQCADTDGN
ncbi:SPFH domain-containing protein [Desulforudis sp. 1088]|jgi:regulator of protease activity HflC (stomatin/prohibitin superfamily)|uniref:SPFH domain-containing protein n=1 Tax=unclassified Candidatus Desulforudis TaxID=2635950 RepID=UPI003480456E